MKVIKLYKYKTDDHEYSYNRMFRVRFNPDPNQEDFCIGMKFEIVSVNRTNGSVVFSMDTAYSYLPLEDDNDRS